MSPRPGGEADKFGNRFEGRWTVRHMLHILAGTADSMVIEEAGESGEGIEFSVARPDGTVEAHQVKRQSGNANSWTLASLVGLGVIKAAEAQIRLGREFHFVSIVHSRKLQELSDRSRYAVSIEAFHQDLPEGLRADFETFTRAVGADGDALSVLRSLHLQVIDERELVNTNETIARLLAIGGASPRVAAAVLADIALDNLGRTLDGRSIRQELRRFGLSAADVTRAPALAAALQRAEDLRLTWLSPFSDQRAKLRELAPLDGLRDRDDEISALVRFCETDGHYLQLAGLPWAGKTALLASFALDPPDGLDILSFFVNSQTVTESDSSAFIDALLSQLANLLGEPTALPSEPRERDIYLRKLLSQCADQVHAKGRRLLLIVDALDEDRSRGSAHGQPSIASLLPVNHPPGLRVLVAARAGYEHPADMRDNHPLRNCPKLNIAPSRWAEIRQGAAEQELQDLLAHNERRELLAFLAASGGGLSRDDLAVLTSFPPFLISQAFSGIAARTVIRSSTDPSVPPTYAFAHEQLLDAAKSAFGTAMLEQRRARIEEWADAYQSSGWPADTPRYLLTTYGTLLAKAYRTPKVVSLATDSPRHERMLDLADGHASALREIDVAGQLLVTQTPDDLRSALRLAIERQDVGVGHRVAYSVMTTWAAVGLPDRAEALARSAGSPQQVSKALFALAVALTRYGNTARAERILGTTANTDLVDAALARMAHEAARAQDMPTAASLAGRVTSRRHADRAMAVLVSAAADAGDFEWAESLLRTEVTGPQMRAQALASIVAARARTGDVSRALARVGQEPGLAARSTALEALAYVVISRRDLEGFKRVLSEIEDDVVAERCRAESVEAVYNRGGRAAAEELIASLQDLSARDRASVNLALSLVRDHRLSDAEQVIADVRSGTVDATVKLATAVAGTGDFDNAERLAKEIRKEERRSLCLAAIAKRAAELGQFDRAEYLAREIAKPPRIAVALAAIARIRYRADADDHGLALAAEETYRNNVKRVRTLRALRAMAISLADIGDVGRSLALMKSISPQVDRQIVAQSLAPALVRGGLTDDAERLWSSLPTNGRTRLIRGAMAVAYAEIGNRSRADELIESLAHTLQGVVGLSYLANYLASTGDIGQAADTSRRAAQEAYNFPEAQHVLVSVAGALVHAGDVDTALSVARRITDRRRIQAAIAEIASALADAGDITHARALLRDLDVSQFTDNVLIRLVRAATVADDLPLAYRLLEEIQGDWSRSVARAAAACVLCDTRRELCDGLLREAATIARRSSEPSRTLADIAATAYSPALKQPARHLLTEAFTLGAWTPLLPALSHVDPAMLAALADLYIPAS